jgi:signal transduction histidine kinase
MAELIIPERYREAHYAGLARYVATGLGPMLGRRVELSALRRDGTEFPVELGILAIERQGRPLFTGTLRDITERKRNEGALAQAHAELRRHASELEDRVRERTASLDESLKSLETLLYTIAHDLRAPNRAMQGYAQLLTQGYADNLDDEGRFFVERISQAAIRNERLIRDLLEFGRLVHAELPCRAMNPEAAIAGVLTALEAEIKASQATVHAASPWPEVWANDSTLTHALSNLVSNALKYVAPGTRPNVRIFPKTVDGKVRICVEDNGIGVAPEQHKRIFEPFQRAAPAKYEGTGMGLAIVRKAAERMGGGVGVESTPGKGSCFWVELLAGTNTRSGIG